MAATFFELVEEDGINYYKIPANTRLYRGDNHIYENIREGNPVILPSNKPTFFGTSVENVEEYGIVFEFITDKEYRLLALDNEITMGKIYDAAPTEIQTILKKNYGYRHPKKLRNSAVEKDVELSQYLCSRMHGYATNTMRTDFEGKFHPEIMICHPQQLEYVRQVTTDPDIIAHKLEESKSRKQGQKMEEARSKKGRSMFGDKNNSSSQKKGRNMFGDDDDESSSPPKGKIPFGYDSPPRKGGSRNRKTNKRKKNTKRRKTNKRRNM